MSPVKKVSFITSQRIINKIICNTSYRAWKSGFIYGIKYLKSMHIFHEIFEDLRYAWISKSVPKKLIF